MLTDVVFHNALSTLFGCRPNTPAVPNNANGGTTGSTTHLHLHRVTSTKSLSDTIPSSVIACFQALSPRATRLALSMLDRHLGTVIPPSPDDSEVYILRDIVTIYVHARRHVCLAVSGEDGNRNIVSLRDVSYDGAATVITNETDDSLNDAFCNCREFIYRPTDENYCHHVIIAAIATTLGLAPIEHVEQNKFLDLLKVNS